MVERLLPYWYDQIVPSIRSGAKVLICAHGSSVRSLIKHLDHVPDDEIVELNVPTGSYPTRSPSSSLSSCFSGIPLVYELDKDLKAIKHHYVASDEIVKKAIEDIANQGKAKK